jgi:hypothetical protein
LDDRHSHLRITKINARLPDCGGVGLHRWASAKYERAMTMAILVQETALAWALAEAVKPHLSAIERNHVFMAIGAGETFAAFGVWSDRSPSSESRCDPIWCNSA